MLPTQKVHLSAYVWCLTSGKTPYDVFEGTTRPVWIPHTIFDIPHAIDPSLLDHVWFEECHIDAMYAQIDFPSSEQDLQSFVILSALKVASPASMPISYLVLRLHVVADRLRHLYSVWLRRAI